MESTLTNENFVTVRIKHTLEVTNGRQFFPTRDKTGNIPINGTMKRVRVTTAALENQ